MSFTKTSRTNIPGSYFTLATINSSLQPWGPQGAPSTWNSTITYPENLKSWRELIKTKHNATTVLTGQKIEVINPGFKHVLRLGYRLADKQIAQNVWSGYFQSLSPVLAPISPSLQNAARAKFLSTCKKVQQPFMAKVFFGELHETLYMIRHPFSALYKDTLLFSKKVKKLSERKVVFRAVKRNKGKAFKLNDLIEAVSDLYLEFTFGARPLVQDIDDGMKALSRKFLAVPTFPVGVSVKDGHLSSQALKNQSNANSGFIFNNTSTQFYSDSVRINGAIKLTPNDVKTACGLNVSDPAFWLDFVPSAYELVPWSFILDYVSNVGELLDAATFLKSDLAWACEVIHQSVLVTRDITITSCPNAVPFPFGVLIQNGVPFQARNTTFSRNPYFGDLGTSVMWRGPSLLHNINIGALIASFGSSSEKLSKRSRVLRV
jgi:hypothetical protein